MKANEIVLFKKPRASSAPTIVDGQIFCTAKEREELYEICERLSKTGQKIADLTRSAVNDYFLMGKWLWNRLENFPRGSSTKDLQRALPEEIHLSYDTICRALKLYKFFEGRQELLLNLTLREAIKIITGADKTESKPVVKYEADEEAQLEFDADAFFSLPTLSGVPLETVRFSTKENELFLVRKGFSHPERIAVVYADVPDKAELRTAYSQMMSNIQREAEKFFSVVEMHGE
jgi:hypothetical protein